MYAGPLSAVRAVMRDKNAESLPLPLTVRMDNIMSFLCLILYKILHPNYISLSLPR